MTDKLYTFGCSFNVVKRADSPLIDHDLALSVFLYLKQHLTPEYTAGGYRFVTESIHPIMVGPKGGVDVD